MTWMQSLCDEVRGRIGPRPLDIKKQPHGYMLFLHEWHIFDSMSWFFCQINVNCFVNLVLRQANFCRWRKSKTGTKSGVQLVGSEVGCSCLLWVLLEVCYTGGTLVEEGVVSMTGSASPPSSSLVTWNDANREASHDWSERHTPVTTDTFSLFVFKMSTTYRCQKRPENFMVNLVENSRSSHIQFQCWTIPESGYCPDSGIAQHWNGLRKKKMVWE